VRVILACMVYILTCVPAIACGRRGLRAESWRSADLDRCKSPTPFPFSERTASQNDYIGNIAGGG
jgi:hypothetical protein